MTVFMLSFNEYVRVFFIPLDGERDLNEQHLAKFRKADPNN